MPGGVIKSNKDKVVASINDRNRLARFWGKAQAGTGVLVTNAFVDYPSDGQGDPTVLTNSNAFYKWSGTAFVKISEDEGLDFNPVTIVQSIVGAGAADQTLSTAALKVLVDSKQDSSGTSFPQTYFVSPVGNDATGIAGDFTKPFSPTKATELAVVGDIISFLPGDYVLTKSIAKNGITYTTFGGKAKVGVNTANVFLFDYQVLEDSTWPVMVYGEFEFFSNAANGGIFRFKKNFVSRSYTIKWLLASIGSGAFMQMPYRIDTGLFEGDIEIQSASPDAAIVCDGNGSSGTAVFRSTIVNKSDASAAIKPFFSGYTFIVNYQGTKTGLFSQPMGAGSSGNKCILNLSQTNPCTTFLFTGDYDISCTGGSIIIFNGQSVSIKGRLSGCTFRSGPASLVSIRASATSVSIINDQVTCLEIDGVWKDCSYNRTSTHLAVLKGHFINLHFLTSVGILKVNGYVRLVDTTSAAVNANEYLEVNGKLVGNVGGGVIKLSQRSPIVITGQVKNLNAFSPVMQSVGGGWKHLVSLKNCILEAGGSAAASIDVNAPDSIDFKLYGPSYSNKPIAGTGVRQYLVGAETDLLVDSDTEVINQ